MEIAMRDEVDESMPRVHESDIEKDFKSLNRRGQRNLYLLLKTQENGKDVWRFPQGSIEKDEFLHVVCLPFDCFLGPIQRAFSRLPIEDLMQSADDIWTPG
jgi:hypothetical protein